MANRKQFGRMFAEAYGITYKSSEIIVKDIFEYLATFIYAEGNDLTIPGFGSFKHKTMKAQQIRNPATGEIIFRPATDYVKFIPSRFPIIKKE